MIEDSITFDEIEGSHNDELTAFFDDELVLLSGSSNRKLGHAIAGHLGMDIQEPVSQFADGEKRVRITHNLRNRDVAIVQPIYDDAHIIELILMADAARKASGDKITAVIPHFGYQRQDKKDNPRVPISAALMARIYEEAGIDHIITMDLHNEAIEGAFAGPWDNLYASNILIPAIQAWNLDNPMFVSPDAGSVKRTQAYANRARVRMASVYKDRDYSQHDKAAALGLMGDVEGMDCVIIDDLISTGLSMKLAALMLLEQGGARSVSAAATHGVFPPGARMSLYNSPIERILITDTIPQSPVLQMTGKFQVESVAPMLADAIRMNQRGQSLSEKLIL
ncbi:MAG: hypothetical protein RI947_636 [Candidatus Parcubacteria bacterium]|jgi:ribose-phosphate pyrophosphokinase